MSEIRASAAAQPELPFDDEALPYFVLHGQDATGPFSVEEIRAQLEQGIITAESYAWNQALDEWLPLSALFDFAPAPPEPVPSVQLQPVPASPPAVLPLAGFGRRVAAGAADLAIIVLAYLAAMLIFPPFRGWVEGAAGDSASQTKRLAQVNLVLSVLVYLYYLTGVFLPGRGATPGYRLLGIRLARQESQRPPGLGRAFLWCLGSMALPVGWVTYWLDDRRRMLHNIVSGTVVVVGRPERGGIVELMGKLRAFATLLWPKVVFGGRMIVAFAVAWAKQAALWIRQTRAGRP